MGWRLFERFHRLGDNFLGLLGNRLELFGIEVQEEAERLLGHLALLLVTIGLAAFALAAATLAVLLVAARLDCLLAAACGVAGVYALLALVCGWRLARRLHTAPPPFAATRAEFARDRQTLHTHPESEA